MPRGPSAASSGAVAAGGGAVRGHAAHERVAAIQRARMLAAMAHAACEQGAGNVTVADVVARSGVSRRTFYEIFSDVHDCLLAALEDGLEQARARVLPVYLDAPGGWRARIRAGLEQLLLCFDEQPHIARLLVVEWLGAGRRALALRRELLAQIARAVDEGREAKGGGQAAADAGPPPIAAEGVVGGVLAVLHARLSGPEPPGRLAELTSPLMSTIVLPYLGAAAARRELARPAPQASPEQADAHIARIPPGGLKMRLTYRTMRVLAAVAADPGASNRAVAQAAGIQDQGQVSKLLRRLQKLDMLENTSPRDAQRKGEPNAWKLTPRGEEVERSVRIGPASG